MEANNDYIEDTSQDKIRDMKSSHLTDSWNLIRKKRMKLRWLSLERLKTRLRIE